MSQAASSGSQADITAGGPEMPPSSQAQPVSVGSEQGPGPGGTKLRVGPAQSEEAL